MNKVIAPSDFVADVIEHPTECTQGGGITRLDRGACINCLLREGLAAKGEASREAFESVLAEANVADTQWRLGHYEILEEIGRGGMGVIYRARQQHSRRIVAVKRILAHQVTSHETLVRFRREAEAVAGLDHPNILPIYEVSESEDGLPFFSMKYATGGSLRAAAPALRVEPRNCVRLMAKIARAIAYAHDKGILHRDLQPGNILLDGNGEPMVSDQSARSHAAGALADDLESWLRHEPMRARRVGLFTHGRKWVRRNPTTTVLVGSLVALTAAISVMFWERESPHPLPLGVAVLPFENLSADPENAFFADGVQDEILNDLAKIADLKVISRTSVMQYKSGAKRNLRQIANELGVAHVVEGSVQRAANRVRVTAQLIDARTDTHLWVERYNRPLDDVFAIQSDIAKAIATQLQAKLSPKTRSAIEERPTKDLVAYDLYVRAKLLVMAHFINEKNYLEAESLLDQAIARDSDFFLAHCLSAEVQSRLYWNFDHNPERRDLAERAVKAAFHLRPEAGESHLARAQYLARCNLDYDNARAELALAQRGLPNNAQVFTLLGHIDRLQGRWNESVRNFDEALELDPRNLLTLRQLSLAYLFMRRLAESAATVDRAVALAPQDDELRAYRASIDLDWRADPKPLHKTLEAMINQNLTGSTDWGESWLDLALRERDPVATGRALAAIGDGFHRGGLYFSRSFM